MAKRKKSKPLTKPDPNAPGHPIGKALKWTAADYRRMSRVSDEDKMAAKAHSRRLLPKPLKRLLDGEK